MSSAGLARHDATLLVPILLRVAASAALAVAGWLLVLVLAPPAASASGIDAPGVDRPVDNETPAGVAAAVDETSAVPVAQPWTPTSTSTVRAAQPNSTPAPNADQPRQDTATPESADVSEIATPLAPTPPSTLASEGAQAPSETAAPETGPVVFEPVRTAVRDVADIGQTALRHVGQVTETLGAGLGTGVDRGGDEPDARLPLPLPDLGGSLPDGDAPPPPDVDDPAPEPIRNISPPAKSDTTPAVPADAVDTADATHPASPATRTSDTPRPTDSTTATAQSAVLIQQHQLDDTAPAPTPARLAPASHGPAGNVPVPAPSHPDSTGAITAQHGGTELRQPLAVLGAACVLSDLRLAEPTVDPDMDLASDKAALPATAPD